jgi:hypothetical protein
VCENFVNGNYDDDEVDEEKKEADEAQRAEKDGDVMIEASCSRCFCAAG